MYATRIFEVPSFHKEDIQKDIVMDSIPRIGEYILFDDIEDAIFEVEQISYIITKEKLDYINIELKEIE